MEDVVERLTTEILSLKAELTLQMIEPAEFVERLSDLFRDDLFIIDVRWIPPSQSSPVEMRLF